MKRIFCMLLLWLGGSLAAQERFPDGTPLDGWFSECGSMCRESAEMYTAVWQGCLPDSNSFDV